MAPRLAILIGVETEVADVCNYRPGNAEDFDRLYRASYPRILATLVALLRDRSLAEDCAQDTFVRAFAAWRTWKPDAPAEAWLHRIAVNLAVSARRRVALHTAASYIRRLGPPPVPPDPTEGEGEALMAALRRIPAKQAAALVLRHLHGYTNRDIAAAVEIPERTVASRLAAATRRLRVELGDDVGPTEMGTSPQVDVLAVNTIESGGTG